MHRAAPQRQVLGIEIGDTWIHVVEVKKDGRTPEILNHGTVERPAADAEIAAAISQILESNGMTSREAVVAIPVHRAFLRELTFEARERKARRAAELRLNVPEERLVLNYVVQGKTAEGRHAVLMVAIPREVIEAHRRMLDSTGLKIVSMVVAPLGFLAAYRMDDSVPRRGLVLAVHGQPGDYAEFLLLGGGGLRWAEASDIRVPDTDTGPPAAEFWWGVTSWLAERRDVLSSLCPDQAPGQNLLVSGVPGPDESTRGMLREHVGTGYVFYPGDGILPSLRPAYGLALMELGFGVPADVSFQPSMAAVRKLWLQNAVLLAGALGFAYSAFLTHLAVRQKRIGALEAEAGRVEARVDMLAPETERLSLMRDLLAALPTVPAEAMPLEQLYRVWRGLPEGVSIERFQARADGVFEFDFVGCSASYLESAARQRMPDLRFVSTEPVRKGDVDGGRATARWTGGEGS